NETKILRQPIAHRTEAEHMRQSARLATPSDHQGDMPPIPPGYPPGIPTLDIRYARVRGNPSVRIEDASIVRPRRAPAGAGRAYRARWPTFPRRVSTPIQPGQSRGADPVGSPGSASLEQTSTLRDEGRDRRDVHLPGLDVAYADDPARHVHRLVHGGCTLEGHDS